MSYRNSSDNMGEPPFAKGDLVQCTYYGWSTCKYGAVRKVLDMHWNRTPSRRGWILKLEDPRPERHSSCYQAKHFITYIKQEKMTMHIAIDISDNPKLDPNKDWNIERNRIVAQDRSLATVKNLVTDEITRDRTRTFAIFSLAIIAEADLPPVRFRDMK